jgi:hypothetical protein
MTREARINIKNEGFPRPVDNFVSPEAKLLDAKKLVWS